MAKFDTFCFNSGANILHQKVNLYFNMLQYSVQKCKFVIVNDEDLLPNE